jgi:hypothetical protein
MTVPPSHFQFPVCPLLLILGSFGLCAEPFRLNDQACPRGHFHVPTILWHELPVDLSVVADSRVGASRLGRLLGSLCSSPPETDFPVLPIVPPVLPGCNCAKATVGISITAQAKAATRRMVSSRDESACCHRWEWTGSADGMSTCRGWRGPLKFRGRSYGGSSACVITGWPCARLRDTSSGRSAA